MFNQNSKEREDKEGSFEILPETQQPMPTLNNKTQEEGPIEKVTPTETL